jgi:hypothetical protein
VLADYQFEADPRIDREEPGEKRASEHALRRVPHVEPERAGGLVAELLHVLLHRQQLPERGAHAGV